MSATIYLPEPLPAKYFDAGELNYCVRNGNRWTLTAIDTDKWEKEIAGCNRMISGSVQEARIREIVDSLKIE